jgi:hypothetical protein
MDSSDLHRKESRYTGVLIGSMLTVFVGMLMLFTIFLAPIGIAVIIAAIVVAGYAAYRRGDFHAGHG